MQKICSCSLHKKLLNEHGKTCPMWMNLKNCERKSYITENLWTDIMQHLGFSSRILHSSHWKIRFLISTCLHPGENYFLGKLHEIFVSHHNKFDWKCTCDYAERCQVLSEQVDLRYFSVWKFIYMEGFALDQFLKLKPSTIPMEQFHSHLSC